nr:uncharacterized protein LOC101935651 [Chrysemys picta bellii]
MSVFLIISLLLIPGCSFLSYKLMTKDNTTLKKEVKSITIQSHLHHVETRIVLSPSQPMQLAAPQQRSSQGTSLIQTSPIYKQPGDVPPLRPASNVSAVSFAYTDPSTVFSAPIQTSPIYKQPGDVPPLRPASNVSAVSFAYTDPSTVFSAPRNRTPESFLSNLSKSGSLFSMEQHDLFYGSSRSSSRGSMDNPGYKYEDGEGSGDSGSSICPIHVTDDLPFTRH